MTRPPMVQAFNRTMRWAPLVAGCLPATRFVAQPRIPKLIADVRAVGTQPESLPWGRVAHAGLHVPERHAEDDFANQRAGPEIR